MSSKSQASTCPVLVSVLVPAKLYWLWCTTGFFTWTICCAHGCRSIRQESSSQNLLHAPGVSDLWVSSPCKCVLFWSVKYDQSLATAIKHNPHYTPFLLYVELFCSGFWFCFTSATSVKTIHQPCDNVTPGPLFRHNGIYICVSDALLHPRLDLPAGLHFSDLTHLGHAHFAAAWRLAHTAALTHITAHTAVLCPCTDWHVFELRLWQNIKHILAIWVVYSIVS